MLATMATALYLVERPLITPLVNLVGMKKWGLLHLAPMPAWVTIPLTLILLDYTFYLWHILTHKISWLWRIHIVHHVDLDRDSSTALRFHFAEMIVSVVWRAGQVILIGASPLAFSMWRLFMVLEVLFHHSNIELPIAVERVLNKIIVTPRMHGIHHSIVHRETDSNWSSGLTLWDWLHGTLRLNVPQKDITIGVAGYRKPQEVTIGKLLAMPFRKQRPSWITPSGERPTRGETAVSRQHLLS
ncbi:MAG: sterol desaturase family protein [Syntrophobacteraceae bacterium]